MPPILEKLAQARTLAGQLGTKGVATHLARRLITAAPGGASQRLFLMVLSKPRPTPEASEAAKNHVFRFATRADLEKLAQDRSSHLFDRDLESFDNGNRCLLQLDGEHLVGYTWISGSPIFELLWGLHFNMPDDMIYNYNGFTAVKYRGTAFQALRHLKALEQTRGEGKRRLLGFVDHLNYKSLRGVEKSGYQRIGVVRGVKRGGQISFSLTVDQGAWSEVIRSGPKQR